MGGGGIIINRSNVLLAAIMDPCFYDNLCDDDKDKVEAINAKPAPSRTMKDVIFLSAKLLEASCS